MDVTEIFIFWCKIAGIYVGGGMVIHFTRGADQETGTGTVLDRFRLISSPPLHHATGDTPCPRCGYHTKTEGVTYTCLDCFLCGGYLYLFEYGVSPAFFLAKARGGTCTTASSDPTKVVLRRALFLLEKGFGGYHLFKNNCEDFAMYCKTGLLVVTNISVGQSGQATTLLAAASAIVSSPLIFMTTSLGGLAMVGCGMYCVSRYVSDLGVRCDVTRVPVEKIPEMVKEDWVGEIIKWSGTATCLWSRPIFM
ncbi:LRAT domain protein [Spatholobus suberectus]|nr:LRAT domain protein [Spatholobus suberectus]